MYVRRLVNDLRPAVPFVPELPCDYARLVRNRIIIRVRFLTLLKLTPRTGLCICGGLRHDK